MVREDGRCDRYFGAEELGAIEDDSKEHKSGRKEGSCVKGLWIRKPLLLNNACI